MKLAAYLTLAVWMLMPAEGSAQQESIYMAVLSAIGSPYDASGAPRFGIFVSTDRGDSWHHRGWEDYIRTFYAEEAADGVLWAACGNGVLRSTDAGKSWRVTTGWDVTEVLKVKASESDPRVVFASTAYGVFRSTDGGDSWQNSSAGIPSPFSADVSIDRGDWHHVLAATELGVYRTEDGGERWRESGLSGMAVRVLVQDPHDRPRYWAGTEQNGLFLSEDGGRSWGQRSYGLTSPTICAIAVHPRNEDWIYAGTLGGGVFVSTDGGVQWRESSQGLTDREVHALAVSSWNPGLLFAGTLNGGLFRSTNAGTTWQYLTADSSQVWGLSLRGTPAGTE